MRPGYESPSYKGKGPFVVTCLLVVPCFNEAHRWSHDYWASLTSTAGVHWRFVDDGSTDQTPDILRALAHLPNVDVVDCGVNVGKGEAVRFGMLTGLTEEERSFQAIGFMDADGAFRRTDVELLVQAFCEFVAERDVDAVWSSRVALAGRDIRRSRARHYLGRAVAMLLSVGSDPLPYDTQSGLKLFRPSSELHACLDQPFSTRWLFEIEMLTRWKHLTGEPMRIREEPLEFWQDVAGSTITRRESARIARELWQVKRLQHQRNLGRVQASSKILDR